MSNRKYSGVSTTMPQMPAPRNTYLANFIVDPLAVGGRRRVCAEPLDHGTLPGRSVSCSSEVPPGADGDDLQVRHRPRGRGPAPLRGARASSGTAPVRVGGVS